MVESKKLAADRADVLRYLKGSGLDLGAGMGKITPTALGIDWGSNGINWEGNATDLHWFRDNVLDYVFSSHMLEHVDNEDTVLREWIRVIKPGGYLVLYLPDDEKFDNSTQIENGEHKRVYTLGTMKQLLKRMNLRIVECFQHFGPVVRFPGQSVYSLLGVGQKR
jgi:ubiquinone/menaquinone biosynthesis C-methylase UbiE